MFNQNYTPVHSVTNQIFSYTTPCSLDFENIIMDSIDESSTQIKLRYSSKFGVVVSIFVNVTEIENVQYNLTEDFKICESKAYEKHYLCKEGLDKEIKCKIPIGADNLADLEIHQKSEFSQIQRYAFIVRLEPQKYKHRFVNIYYFDIRKTSDGSFEAKHLKHKIEIKDQCYYIYDIYGMEAVKGKTQLQQGSLGQLCSICFSKTIEVVILPCRHMCLCLECAGLFNQRDSNNKSKVKAECPMCRGHIQSFINIQGIGDS